MGKVDCFMLSSISLMLFHEFFCLVISQISHAAIIIYEHASSINHGSCMVAMITVYLIPVAYTAY